MSVETGKLKSTNARYVSRLTRGTLAVVMAGGRGSRLKHLTLKRSKPGAPFGGKYRIIDFVLSNCVNSGIRQICVLTQYKAHSLIQHLHRGWNYLRGEFGEFIDVVPAQQQLGEVWYRGTADSVFQNLDLIRSYDPDYVLVLAGDHIYKMDYGPMIAYHSENDADITVGVIEVLRKDASEYGVLTVGNDNRITRFAEKPADPDPVPGRDNVSLASMGIYVFSRDLLERALMEDASHTESQHDFGRNIIPDRIDSHRVFAYAFQDVKTRAQHYWRDVGNVDAFFDANIELTFVDPELNIYDEKWPIWTYQEHLPPAKFVFDDDDRRGMAVDSMVAGGCVISGAHVRNSMLFSNVRVEEKSVLDHAVILPGVRIGKNCHIRRAIIDEDCEIPDGTVIGLDSEKDAERFFVTRKGVVLVTEEMLATARNTSEEKLTPA